MALDAARIVGLPAGRVVLFDPVPGSSQANVQDLVTEGLKGPLRFTERRLKPGEAKKKLALFCFSSGTTGKPKVVSAKLNLQVAADMGSHLSGSDDIALQYNRKYGPGCTIP